MLEVIIKTEKLSSRIVKVILDVESSEGVKKSYSFIEEFNGNLTRSVCEWIGWQVFERESTKIEKDFESLGIKTDSYLVITG